MMGKKKKKNKIIPCLYCLKGISKQDGRECKICDGLGNYELSPEKGAK